MLMQPQSPSPAPPPIAPGPPGHDPYAFITSPGVPKKRGLLPGGNSVTQRIIIVAGGALLLIILASVIFSALGNAGKGDVETLRSAVQQQQELIRVADTGTQKAKGPTAKNYATTIKLTLSSDQAELQKIVKKSLKIDAKTLNGGKDAETDELLTAAEQTNRFDEEFTTYMQREISEYMALLKKIYDGSDSQTAKTELAKQYDHAQVLLGKKD
jgi:predicted outer membrane protein